MELLRFVFCLCVLFFHISLDVFGRDFDSLDWHGVCRYGGMAVEFFFLVSGYLLAKSADKMNRSDGGLGGFRAFSDFGRLKDLFRETLLFGWRKLLPLLPYHLILNAIQLIVNIVFEHPSVRKLLLLSSSFLFLPTFGVNNGTWLIGAEWYIGYMLFGVVVIYPLLRCWYKAVSAYAAPTISILLYVFLALRFHTVVESNRLIRSFAGLLMGVYTFHAAACLADKKLSPWISRIFRYSPIIIILFYIAYMNTRMTRSIQSFLVLFLAAALIIIWAEKGLFSEKRLFNRKVFYWLGEISLPLYIVQGVVRTTAKYAFGSRRDIVFIACEIVFTVLGVFPLHFFCRRKTPVKERIKNIMQDPDPSGGSPIGRKGCTNYENKIKLNC